MSQRPIFDVHQYLRSMERTKHADLVKELRVLINSLGYDEHVHQFIHAEKFLAVIGMYPSLFLVYVQALFAPVSKVAEDHITEEGLAILNIVTESAIHTLRQSSLQTDDELADILQGLAVTTITAWEQEKEKPFLLKEHIGDKFTLPQARTYMVKYAKEYEALPGKETADGHRA
jgi:DNA-binding XRE family transcriptional regulator